MSYILIAYFRYFEAHTSLENDVVDNFANRFCHMDSDAKRSRKAEGKVKDVEILRIGEQVRKRFLLAIPAMILV